MPGRRDRDNLITSLYEKYYDYLVSCCCNKLSSYSHEMHNMIEDIVQEAFVVAVDRYDQLQNHPNKVGWLLQTCYYKMKNENTEIIKRLKASAFSIDEDESPDLADPKDVIKEHDDEEETTELIQAIKTTISQRDMLLFEEYFVKDHSVSITSANTERTEHSVRNSIYRMRQKAKEIRKKYFSESETF